jgi:response regulator RpfG family c-di-GMP phosphodiesterase
VFAPPDASGTEGARILLVDDEPALLSSMRRQLSTRFRVETEADPIAALDRIGDLDNLAVIVSDMRMPGMNGATFLGHVCDRWPDITRVLLTGFAEIDSAIAAVNQGRIFRFLSKPITPDEFKTCLDDAVRQHQLVCAERELLEQTLRGSVKALVETLSMANPTAFARATRIGSRVVSLAEHINAPNQWEIEVAGLLSHIGTVVLPPGINERLQSGKELTLGQQEYVAELPTIALSVLADIPRLDSVRHIIAFQRQRFDGRGPVAPDVGGEDIPLGSRILRIATEYDTLEARGTSVNRALQAMANSEGLYDPAVLHALEAVLSADSEREMAYVKLADLRSGMVLAGDLRTIDNTLLVSRGQELTARTIMRIQTWAAHTSIAEPVAVYVQADVA